MVVPHTICGMDSDEVFAYSTKKVVWVRSRWIGILYYVLIFVIVCYILVGQIILNNEHFVRKDVNGVGRVMFFHPTKNHCDPSTGGCKSDYLSYADLNYCAAYKGREHGYDGQRAKCFYMDSVNLQDGSSRIGSMFIPTAVEVVTEKRICIPSEENNWVCDREYEALPGSDCLHGLYLCRNRGGQKDQFYYVADVRNFWLQFTGTYSRDTISGSSLDQPAFVQSCKSQRRSSREVRSWRDRLKRNSEVCHDVERHKMKCAEGVDCDDKRTLQKPKLELELEKDLGMPDPDIDFDPLKPSAESNEKAMRSKRETRRGHWQGFLQTGHLKQTVSTGNSKVEVLDAHKHANAISSSAESDAEIGEDMGKLDEYSGAYGDIFTLKRLMALSGANLDNDYSADNYTVRQSGIALEVQQIYNNLYPVWSTLSLFGIGETKPEYYYKVRQLSIPYVSRIELRGVKQPDDYPAHRRYEIRYGVQINFSVSGTFGFFSFTDLLIMLTTAFALTASATTITDFVALYLHPQKDNFFHLKYDVSPDFSDTWQCSKCGYSNTERHKTCQGLPQWTSVDDQDVNFCGVCREHGVNECEICCKAEADAMAASKALHSAR